ncbi:MAG TPA: choice-of-anchor Q domain-containing protein, partial [bacterium]|nr:choice-of-anchor Q domain-containing protein [bacterium]
LTINNSFFDDNQATVNVSGLSSLGGAISMIGLDFDNGTPYENVPARITNTVFVNNTAGLWGGAILNVYYPDAEFTNCTFYNNTDGSGNSIVHAGALPSTPATTYKNSIIWDDVAILEGDLGGGFVFGPSKMSFQNSDVMGSGGSSAWNVAFVKSVMGGAITTTDFVDNGGNIDADPLFDGAGLNPHMITAASPCANAGDNSLVPIGISKDIIGNSRVVGGVVDMGAYESSFVPPVCDPNPCGGATPVCFEDATPDGYTCYPDYSIGWCVIQYPKTFEGAVGDKVDIYGRVWIDGLTNTTVDATDVHPLVKAQFGGAPAGTPVENWASDALVNADPNMAGGADWDNNDEYMVLQHEMKNIGEFDYAFRFSADAGKTWTVCDTEGNMPYHTDKLGYAAVNECMENADCTDPAKPLCSADTYSCVNNAVFFSEYIEGSGTGNKVLEIYNGSTSAVNLSAYTLS